MIEFSLLWISWTLKTAPSGAAIFEKDKSGPLVIKTFFHAQLNWA